MMRYKLIKGDTWKEKSHQLEKLSADISSASTFVREIEKGNLDYSFESQADSELKTSLVNMRDQMKKYALSEKQRNWVNEGLAKFVQILRSGNNEGRQHLADSIIRSLVVYLKANQGALFALNDDDPKDMFLEMEACYAYERKKYFQKRIELGEGLAGQVVLERSTLYMTDVPKDFIKITSGLGEALPRNVLLVPLKLEEKVYGVVEIASFQVFQNYEIDFVEKLSESIAASMAFVKNNERTKTLLKETQLQAEQLRAQEEEVRQNMEELSATQEAMQRAMKEVEVKESYVSQILNTSQDVIYTVDREFRIVMWNSAFAREAERINVRIEKGMDAFGWSPEQRRQLIPFFQRALNGETFEFKWEGDMNGKTMHFLSLYAPIKAESGEIIEVGIYAKNITPMVEAQQETARLLNDAQQQAEELKAQEEELRQNMEEMQTTQEELKRIQLETEAQTNIINSVAIVSKADKKGNITFVNDEFIKWSKYTREELIGKNHRILKSGHQPDKIFVDMWKTISSGKIWRGEVKNRAKDGSYYWVDAIIAPVLDEHGKPKEYIAQRFVINDKKEQEEVTQRLLEDSQAKEAYGAELLNATDDLIYTVDKELKLITWNKAFARVAEVLKIQLTKSMNAFEWWPDYRQALIPLWTRVFNGETFQYQWESVREGGKDYYLSIYAPVRSKSGQIVEAVVFAKNIAQLVEAQQESTRLLKEAQQQAEELKAQEEELRQNMEELSATQETMEQKTREVEAREDYLTQLLNTSQDVIFTVDREFKLVTWNNAFEQTVTALQVQPKKGMIAFQWRPLKEQQHFFDLFSRVFNGETFETIEESRFDGKLHHLMASYSPIRNQNNEIVEAAIFAKDVTNIVNKRNNSSDIKKDIIEKNNGKTKTPLV